MKIHFLSESIDQGEFVSRTAIVTTIAAATVAAAFVLWKLTDLLPAVFATVLIALAWRGLRSPLPKSQVAGMKQRLPSRGCRDSALCCSQPRLSTFFSSPVDGIACPRERADF